MYIFNFTYFNVFYLKNKVVLRFYNVVEFDVYPDAKFLSQPRSQGLSSLPPLVVGRKTLVAAGHMTTQNLGGKKICWVGGVAEYFVWLM